MEMTANTLFPQWGTYRRWHQIIFWLGLALLALMWLAGYGPGGSACKPITISAPAAPAAPMVAAPALAPVPAPPPMVAAAPVVAAVALPPAARVYFDLDKFALPVDTTSTLNEVVTYLKANPGTKALISGFHDPSGNKAHNEELALNRARAVRGELDKLGISNDRVVMAKPVETTGTGAPREARRVEVSVQQ
jgi:outer membrane protein OmpA-like peptidoglycan-associated protein